MRFWRKNVGEILDELLSVAPPINAEVRAFRAALDADSYRTLVTALRRAGDEEALTHLAYACAREMPPIALAALLPLAVSSDLDELAGDPRLAVDVQTPMPSKMVYSDTELDLRLQLHGTALRYRRPADPAFVRRVVRLLGPAVSYLGVEVDMTALPGAEDLDASELADQGPGCRPRRAARDSPAALGPARGGSGLLARSDLNSRMYAVGTSQA